MNNQKTVLITGGGGGIGKEFCKLFYANGDNIIVASLLESELEQLKEELPSTDKQFVETLRIDLSLDDSANTLYQTVKDRHFDIDILINNAGFGAYGKHIDLEYDRLKAMVNLNCQTPTLLCHLFGNDMKSKRSGKILNVGSTISFQPLPYLINYSASKAFIVTFSQGFSEEMAPYGVTVSCLCPGTTATAFLDTAGIHENKTKGTVGNTAHQIAMAPEQVARIGYEGLEKNKRLIIPGVLNTVHKQAIHWIPNRLVTWASHQFFRFGEKRNDNQMEKTS